MKFLQQPPDYINWVAINYSNKNSQIQYQNINTGEVIKVPNVHYNQPQRIPNSVQFVSKGYYSFADQQMFRTGFWSN